MWSTEWLCIISGLALTHASSCSVTSPRHVLSQAANSCPINANNLLRSEPITGSKFKKRSGKDKEKYMNRIDAHLWNGEEKTKSPVCIFNLILSLILYFSRKCHWTNLAFGLFLQLWLKKHYFRKSCHKTQRRPILKSFFHENII